MAHDAHLKRKAIDLRATGMALDDIVLRLALPARLSHIGYGIYRLLVRQQNKVPRVSVPPMRTAIKPPRNAG